MWHPLDSLSCKYLHFALHPSFLSTLSVVVISKPNFLHIRMWRSHYLWFDPWPTGDGGAIPANKWWCWLSHKELGSKDDCESFDLWSIKITTKCGELHVHWNFQQLIVKCTECINKININELARWKDVYLFSFKLNAKRKKKHWQSANPSPIRHAFLLRCSSCEEAGPELAQHRAAEIVGRNVPILIFTTRQA